ncbi:Insect odorant-binding protein A10/Ejaculatory bulb-specific protein 3 [Cinara cedri]|uniref:Insect odorant-binding protein A10/Ejaculatory bulb-specific protein 3 n=1 Tax=Cinara cedri TaxID=506608 RepID=A0A5E4M4R2_9HEMI|nr:Insect odorant-binding protein A10/Ejaculatory bulb-specific protein 3 [Cinara cedri]
MSSFAMRIIWFFGLYVCATLARPQDLNVENVPKSLAAAAPTVIVKRATLDNGQPDLSLPNVNDNVLDKALNNKKFVDSQLKCAMGEGPCDNIGRKIKAYAPLVLRNMCNKCTQSDIRQIQRVMSHIQRNYPKDYAKILNKYQNGV